MKRFSLVLAVAISMVACTTDSADEVAEHHESLVPITFSAVNDEGVTRAGMSLLTTLEGEDVNVYMQATKPGVSDPVPVDIIGLTNNHAVYSVGGISAGSYPLTNASTFYKPAEATVVTAYALFPSTVEPVSFSSEASITVNSDQSSDNNYKASDLCFADAVTLSGTTMLSGTLAFHHLMAKVIVSLTASVENIKKIELVNVKPTLTFTPSTYTFSNSSLENLTVSGAATTITVYNGDAITSGTFACVIPPQELQAGIFIQLTNETDIVRTYSLGAATTFYPGTVNTYTLTIANNP